MTGSATSGLHARQRGAQLLEQQPQLELAELEEGAPRPCAQLEREREWNRPGQVVVELREGVGVPFELPLQHGRQHGYLQREVGGSPERKLIAQIPSLRDRLVEHRHQGGRREAPLQVGVGADRAGVGVGDKQDCRIDRSPRGLVEEADLLDDREERLEPGVAEVDHLGEAVIHDQAVEQRHLVPDVRQIGDGVQARDAIPQPVPARIEIEGDGLAAVEAKKVDEQPRQEGLAHLWARRRYDEDRCALDG
jgi:hypothetical protein